MFEHTSTLRSIERPHGLPTLASTNHMFDTSTPTGPSYEAAGSGAAGPAAPPRDRLDQSGDLLSCFTF